MKYRKGQRVWLNVADESIRANIEAARVQLLNAEDAIARGDWSAASVQLGFASGSAGNASLTARVVARG